MGRAPCCEKMGLKRGPWTPEEDRVLVAYIGRYGHENWRALPKLAGLLRCGKSCRLRWINYLKPDIKRGNFTVEEENTIIQLHEMLGNRWSAIAARLPGRTDNEIKNVWHTHLKKRLSVQDSKRKPTRPSVDRVDQTCSDVSSSSTSGGGAASSSSSDVPGACREEEEEEEEGMDSWMEFPDIDESFWSEALMPLDVSSSVVMDVPDPLPSGTFCGSDAYLHDSFNSSPEAAAVEDDMSFWLRVFMEAGVMQDLPEIII